MFNRSKPLRFVLPPSYAALERERRQQLEEFLGFATSLPVEVAVAPSYDALTNGLLSGQTNVAWAPPYACARLETVSVPILVRAVRSGQATYRAALVCRADSVARLDTLQGRRAAWVDRESAGGYLLVAAFLRARGIELDRTFASQRFLGSYQSALGAVLADEADVTSVYAAPESAGGRATGIEEVLPGTEGRFRVISFTDEAPNDGIALAPFTAPELAKAIEHALVDAEQLPAGKELLQRVFRAERFEPAPKNGYRALYQSLRTLR